jgi:hypothetical protein
MGMGSTGTRPSRRLPRHRSGCPTPPCWLCCCDLSSSLPTPRATVGCCCRRCGACDLCGDAALDLLVSSFEEGYTLLPFIHPTSIRWPTDRLVSRLATLSCLDHPALGGKCIRPFRKAIAIDRWFRGRPCLPTTWPLSTALTTSPTTPPTTTHSRTLPPSPSRPPSSRPIAVPRCAVVREQGPAHRPRPDKVGV